MQALTPQEATVLRVAMVVQNDLQISCVFCFFSSVWYGTCQITKTLTLTGHEKKKHGESGCCWVWCSASSRLQLIHGGKAIAPKLFQPQLGSKAFESGFAVSTKSWYLGTSSFWVSFHSLRLGFHVVAAGSRRRLHSYPNKMYTTKGKAHTPLRVWSRCFFLGTWMIRGGQRSVGTLWFLSCLIHLQNEYDMDWKAKPWLLHSRRN